MSLKDYLDLQVNGYLGVDYSSESLTQEDFIRSARAMIDSGHCRFLPTLITSSAAVYQRNLNLIAAAIDSAALGRWIPGIHIEGPFISGSPGAVGAHQPQWIRKADLSFLDSLQNWAHGKIKLMTIAAEIEGAEALCRHAVAMGITVSLGHQSACVDDMRRLVQAGATLLTHFGNGMPNQVHRHFNQILAGLAVPELTPMLITDGHHLPAHVIQVILRSKGLDKIIVTSDASPIAGLPPGHYNTLGNEVVLETSGLLHNPQKQCLVGSSANIRQCVQYLTDAGFITPGDASTVARANPSRAIGLPA